MLENAIQACPDAGWGRGSGNFEFWYIAFHTLFFLDFYSGPADGFAPPAPFSLTELDPAGQMPERVYTKEELRNYLVYGREKCRAALLALTEEQALTRYRVAWLDISMAELFLYTMRHVQHHSAQLNLILRQTGGSVPRYVKFGATKLY